MSFRSPLLMAAAIALAPSVGQAQAAGCRSSDAATAKILWYVKSFATTNIPARDSVGLVGVDTALVVSETDSTSCARVAAVVDSAFEKPSGHPYVVIRAGSVLVAFQPSTDPDHPSQLLHFLDSSFVYKRTLVAF